MNMHFHTVLYNAVNLLLLALNIHGFSFKCFIIFIYLDKNVNVGLLAVSVITYSIIAAL